MFIVVMHSGLFPQWLLPLPRLAVPLFFIMTSYFFHLKLKSVTGDKERKDTLIKYVRRNAQLYLFWSIVLLPTVIVLHQSWFRGGFVNAIIQIIKGVFITGFFPASWFIIASVYSVVIVFVLSKWLNNVWLFIIALLVYTLALFDSNYGGMLNEKTNTILNAADIRWSLNLPAALIWVVIGKFLADKPVILSKKVLYPLLAVAIVLYMVEAFFVNRYHFSVHNDCFLTSIVLCTLIFIAIGQSSDIQCKHALWLRKSSIIVYCVHLTIIRLLKLASLYVFWLPNWAIYTITLIVSLCIAYFIIYFCETKKIKILRKAY
jgi:hypothetical protein